MLPSGRGTSADLSLRVGAPTSLCATCPLVCSLPLPAAALMSLKVPFQPIQAAAALPRHGSHALCSFFLCLHWA